MQSVSVRFEIPISGSHPELWRSSCTILPLASFHRPDSLKHEAIADVIRPYESTLSYHRKLIAHMYFSLQHSGKPWSANWKVLSQFHLYDEIYMTLSNHVKQLIYVGNRKLEDENKAIDPGVHAWSRHVSPVEPEWKSNELSRSVRKNPIL